MTAEIIPFRIPTSPERIAELIAEVPRHLLLDLALTALRIASDRRGSAEFALGNQNCLLAAYDCLVRLLTDEAADDDE